MPRRDPIPRTLLPAALFAVLTAVWGLAARGETSVSSTTVSVEPVSIRAPWRAAGLTEREAAAHALDRLAFGARPGEVERVAEMGVDRWLERQLLAAEPEPVLEEKLERLEILDLDARQMAERFPSRGMILRRAVAAGILEAPERPDALSREDRRAVRAWARAEGIRPQGQALDELGAHKLFGARYAENQLAETLVDFWFNHFNVSITDPQARPYLWPYERDAIRPFVLGDFGDMLEATARHPAMLHYLDNAGSVASAGEETTLDHRLEAYGRRGQRLKARLEERRRQRLESRPNRPSGLNENYARELMELHTLGVDGGYSQRDVVEVARAFTGWTALPPAGLGPGQTRDLSRMRRHPEAGFVLDEKSGFLFRADAHDAGAKTVLGHRLDAGRGLEDGLEVLEILAAHPSTARHLAGKLAARFLSDQPPPAVIERLAESFTRGGGDLRRVMRTLLESPEFWAPAARSAKIKSPFELAASALRATGAELVDPRPTAEWIERMGQPLYAYQAPTGYPDRAEAWVNTGALLQRMNFGLQLATGRVRGVRLDLPALGGAREPASLDEALRHYGPILLPQRATETVLDRLEPMVRDPELAEKIEASASAGSVESEAKADDGSDLTPESPVWVDAAPAQIETAQIEAAQIETGAVAHVVGVILGSPDFQRR